MTCNRGRVAIRRHDAKKGCTERYGAAICRTPVREAVLRTIRTTLAGFSGIEAGYVFGSFFREDFGDVGVAALVSGAG
ncbi:hypothetical protein [Methanoculleus sp. 10]|uniref:hypothetical protein n=1 Tax=Methanoculleus sp. 10 TaxID=430615 RepID=UPI0025FB605B|nr:hypothetical protein [Methanoculleus sp. 10]